MTSATELAPEERTGNWLLDSLPPRDRRSVLAEATAADWEVKEVVWEQNAPIKQVLLPVRGVFSIITGMDDGENIEIATIGREGLLGVPIFLGGNSNERPGDLPGRRCRPRPRPRDVPPPERQRRAAGSGSALHPGPPHPDRPARRLQPGPQRRGTGRPLAPPDPRPGRRGQVPPDQGVPGADARRPAGHRQRGGRDAREGRVHQLRAGLHHRRRPRGSRVRLLRVLPHDPAGVRPRSRRPAR